MFLQKYNFRGEHDCVCDLWESEESLLLLVLFLLGDKKVALVLEMVSLEIQVIEP